MKFLLPFPILLILVATFVDTISVKGSSVDSYELFRRTFRIVRSSPTILQKRYGALPAPFPTALRTNWPGRTIRHRRIPKSELPPHGKMRLCELDY